MDEKKLKTLLRDVANGRIAPAGALAALKDLTMADLGYARVRRPEPWPR
jgi:hypothetical protein